MYFSEYFFSSPMSRHLYYDLVRISNCVTENAFVTDNDNDEMAFFDDDGDNDHEIVLYKTFKVFFSSNLSYFA